MPFEIFAFVPLFYSWIYILNNLDIRDFYKLEISSFFKSVFIETLNFNMYIYISGTWNSLVKPSIIMLKCIS